MISIHSKYKVIHISKEVVRALKAPMFICLKVNADWTSVALVSCKEKDRLSFRVPEDLFIDNNVGFRICSKEFVTVLLGKNKMSDDNTYRIYGEYKPENNAIVFQMSDAKILLHPEDEEE